MNIWLLVKSWKTMKTPKNDSASIEARKIPISSKLPKIFKATLRKLEIPQQRTNAAHLLFPWIYVLLTIYGNIYITPGTMYQECPEQNSFVRIPSPPGFRNIFHACKPITTEKDNSDYTTLVFRFVKLIIHNKDATTCKAFENNPVMILVLVILYKYYAGLQVDLKYFPFFQSASFVLYPSFFILRTSGISSTWIFHALMAWASATSVFRQGFRLSERASLK